MNLFFWMLLNLGVPIIGPIFTLALVVPAHGWHVAKTLIAGSVKDGQLFWCAIGLFASAIYEAVTALERGRGEASVLAEAFRQPRLSSRFSPRSLLHLYLQSYMYN
ncbi:hypothetical protein RI103_10885 [Paraburkholderia sp. FT54]|uniref:hypothetical protein n=1 Tax=Paraburkholderia sp. FT54 TaxID=3074437 RepID=UPI0028776B70|nr:hypothetical protein [Paraburkholderia sp. FT54]WNC88242.1 hypothetical protein RI103_10885 [Paraburkholderia sp. FT54]